MCKSDMGLFVRIRQDFCDFDWRVCDCVGLGEKLREREKLGRKLEGRRIGAEHLICGDFGEELR